MEWTIVTVLITLFGFGVAIISPIVKLNTAITKLQGSVDALNNNFSEYSTRNSKAHERLWCHNEQQDTKLDEHEKTLTEHEFRLTKLEDHVV